MKEFKFKINGVDYVAGVEEIENGLTEVTVNGKKYQVETEKKAAPAPKAAPKAAPAPAAPATPAAPAPAPAAPAAAPAAAPVAGSKVVSPLPGSVIKVMVSEGQAVKKGDVLLQLESMKMANDIAAECDGTVKQILVAAGQTVMQDDVLLVIG